MIREAYCLGIDNPGFRIVFQNDQHVETLEKIGNDIIVAVKGTTLATEGDPAATVQRYWQLIGDRNFREAWSMLSQRFKVRSHDGDFEDCRRGWLTVYRCDVYARDIRIVERSDRRAVVDATVVFLVGEQCEQHKRRYHHRLIIEDGRWVIDRVYR